MEKWINGMLDNPPSLKENRDTTMKSKDTIYRVSASAGVTWSDCFLSRKYPDYQPGKPVVRQAMRIHQKNTCNHQQNPQQKTGPEMLAIGNPP
jgi:acyl carrier protein phosphodiesterase